MRMCRKCSKQVSDDRKICRDCGAILEEVPSDSEWEPVSQAGAPSAVEPQGGQAGEGGERSVDEVAVESQEPASGNADVSAWKCSRCGDMVPGTFEVCLKCPTIKGGETAIMETAVKGTCPCPVCGNALVTQERLGILIYVCHVHGTWLFKGKLEELLWKFTRADAFALDQAQREIEQLR